MGYASGSRFDRGVHGLSFKACAGEQRSPGAFGFEVTPGSISPQEEPGAALPDRPQHPRRNR